MKNENRDSVDWALSEALETTKKVGKNKPSKERF